MREIPVVPGRGFLWLGLKKWICSGFHNRDRFVHCDPWIRHGTGLLSCVVQVSCCRDNSLVICCDHCALLMVQCDGPIGTVAAALGVVRAGRNRFLGPEIALPKILSRVAMIESFIVNSWVDLGQVSKNFRGLSSGQKPSKTAE